LKINAAKKFFTKKVWEPRI